MVLGLNKIDFPFRPQKNKTIRKPAGIMSTDFVKMSNVMFEDL